MDIKNYTNLPDFAAQDINQDGELTAEESLDLIYYKKSANTLEEVENLIHEFAISQTFACAPNKNDAGEIISWRGMDFFSNRSPENLNIESEAKHAAAKFLTDKDPHNKDMYDSLKDLSPELHTTIFRVDPNFLGGKEIYDAAKIEFDPAVGEATAHIQSWKNTQLDALPKGITLATGAEYCEHLDKELGNLDVQYKELKSSKDTSRGITD